MEIIYILLPLALLVSILFLCLFYKSAQSGQYDDLETPPLRIIAEEDNDS